MIARISGAILILAAMALAALPAAAWFAATVPGGTLSASGFSVAGVLWVLPITSAALALAGISLLISVPEARRAVARWAGPLAMIASLLALGFALWAGIDPDVVLQVDGQQVAGAVDTDIVRRPATWITPGVAMVSALVGLGVTVAAWRP